MYKLIDISSIMSPIILDFMREWVKMMSNNLGNCHLPNENKISEKKKIMQVHFLANYIHSKYYEAFSMFSCFTFTKKVCRTVIGNYKDIASCNSLALFNLCYVSM